MEYFAALDVSMEESKLCVVDGTGRIVREGVSASDPGSIGKVLRGWGMRYRVVGLEAGALSSWLHGGLTGLGFAVVLLETRQAQSVLSGMRNKTDRKDARGLAQLLRTGWYRPVHVKSQGAQDRRALLSARAQVHASLVQIENSLRGLLKAVGARLPRGGRRSLPQAARQAASAWPLLSKGVSSLLATHRVLVAEREKLTRQVMDLARRDADARLLMTVPGVGAIVAVAFAATVDDPGRFARSRSVGAHFGLTARRHQSGEIDRSGRISKCGDRLMRALLFEASTVLLTRVKRWSSLKAWGMAIARRRGLWRARVAVARKLAVIMHRMLVDRTEFRWSAAAAPPATAQAA